MISLINDLKTYLIKLHLKSKCAHSLLIYIPVLLNFKIYAVSKKLMVLIYLIALELNMYYEL